MAPSKDDKKIVNSNLAKEQIDRTVDAVNINSSDHEFCEFKGETIMYYSWGNQKGAEFLAKARYNGTVKNMLEDFFY